MIAGLLWLLGCQLVGEVVVRLLDVPVPGPVVGIPVLLLVLRLRRTRPDDEQDAVVRTAGLLLRHLQLLFVPAGVGVVASATVLRHNALPLGLALVVSWVLGLVVVGVTLTVLTRATDVRTGTAGGPMSGP